MALANTLDEHKASRWQIWHVPNGTHHQVDCIMAQNHFRAGIHKAKTQTFPGADAGSNYDLVTLNFRVRLKKKKKT